MKTKIELAKQMKDIGEIVKQEFDNHNILGLNDIISWKEGYDFKQTSAPFELYQKQIASRKPHYDDINFKIQYLRSYLYSCACD